MENASSSNVRELKDLLDELFARSLAQSVSSLIGEDAEVAAGRPFDLDGEQIWFQWELKPRAYGDIRFGGSKEIWYDLGKRILYGGEDTEADDELIDSTLTEIASQVAGSITTFLNHQYQKQLETGNVSAKARALKLDPAAHRSFHEIRFEDGGTLPVCFGASESLFESLIPVKQQEEKLPAPAVNSKKLDLLLDVEMPVSVSIGRAQMPLKDVVKLTTGSVVELSRNVSEPVDIVVNNCIVARGDVVVVDGNFGVRIREVLSREDRMRQLTSS
jgi:flagellar motor switch protein FliN/FliY